jgi:hypothetical protein
MRPLVVVALFVLGEHAPDFEQVQVAAIATAVVVGDADEAGHQRVAQAAEVFAHRVLQRYGLVHQLADALAATLQRGGGF